MCDVSKLCDVCLTLLPVIAANKTTDKRDHHPSIESLSEAAAAGCHLCILLFENHFSDYIVFKKKSVPLYLDRHLNNLDALSIKVRLYTGDRAPFLSFSVFDTTQEASTNNPSWEDIFGCISIARVQNKVSRPNYNNTSTRKSWEVAFGWIKDCVNSHPECAKRKQQNWRPTRLLDVGTKSEPVLRLDIKDGDSSRTPYMTLSHCWGQIEIKRLLDTNIHQLCQKIDWDELSKTFQDAIEFTREIGVRFLWIDSLCIVQDSLEDWESESASMQHVYENALCNIAATAAMDGTTGCFVDRSPIFAQPCRVQIKNGEELLDLVLNQLWYFEVDTAPLNQRGWVLQENYLSSRILHCGRRQLLWECRKLSACETYPEGIPNGIDTIRRKSNVRHDTPSSAKELVDDSKATQEPLKIWSDLVSLYTQCLLTQETDKLVAISGIAKDLQVELGCEYLAGLWGGHLLVSGLLWTVSHPPDVTLVSRRSKTYRAPSWSWASLDGNINCFGDSEPVEPLLRSDVMIKILECKVYPLTDDVFGHISGGYLKISGWPISLEGLVNPDDYRLHFYDEDILISARLKMDILEEYNLGQLFYLPISGNESTASDYDTEGLLLERNGSEAPNHYRRVGLLSSWSLGDEAGLFTPPKYRVASHISRRKTHERETRNRETKAEIKDDEGAIYWTKAESGLGEVENKESFPFWNDEAWKETTITII